MDRRGVAVDRHKVVDPAEAEVDPGEAEVDPREAAADRREATVGLGAAVDPGGVAVGRGGVAVGPGGVAVDPGGVAADRQEVEVDQIVPAVVHDALAADLVAREAALDVPAAVQMRLAAPDQKSRVAPEVAPTLLVVHGAVRTHRDVLAAVRVARAVDPSGVVAVPDRQWPRRSVRPC